MKKLLAFSLAVILTFSMFTPVFAMGISTDADTEYCGKLDVSGVTALPYTVVDISDLNTARARNAEDVEYFGVNELNPEEFIRLTPTMVETGRRSGIRLEFPGALPNSVYSDFIENVMTEGSSATLAIDTCVWAPEYYQLEVGIYNWTDATNRYVLLYGGHESGYRHVFSGLSEGSYSVYIRNRGASSLTTGYLLYNLY